MRHPLPAALSLSILGLSIGGCAADTGHYPSLAPRAVEKVGFEEPATAAPLPAAPDPALDARLATTVQARATATAQFDKAATRATSLAQAARGAAPGTDRWLDAQTALAELDSLRAAHGDSVSALEDLAGERLQAMAPAYPALERELTQAREAAADQTRRIDAIAAMLSPAK